MIEKIEQIYQGPAVNEILLVIRRGITDIPTIKYEIKRACIEKFNRDNRYGNETSSYWNFLYTHIQDMDADIQKYLDYEKLPIEKRKELKKEKQKFFSKESMRDKRPTPAQEKYLIALGYKGKFDSMTRLDASNLIEELKP